MAYITISKQNLFHNLQEIEKKVGNKDKIAVVLKDNAYGHGLKEIATLCNEYGVTKAILRDTNEATIVKDIIQRVITLNFIDNNYDKKIEVTMNSMNDLEKISNNSKIHLKIDTGMQRNGIQIDKIEQAYELIIKKDLILCGVLTHFRSADELSSELFWQTKNFELAKEKIINLSNKYNKKIPDFHSQASSATFRMNNFDDFVRVGIALYGYIYLPECVEKPKLKPVMSLWGEKISTREIKSGSRVGYGGGYVAKENITISTYDIGYGDGFFRLNETQKFFTKDNEEILGRVSMDSMSIKSTKENICIFNDVSKLAKLCNTIDYDILVKLKSSIPKIII